MKKIILLVTLCGLLLIGCDAGVDKEKEQMQVYESFKDRLLNNNGTRSYDVPFAYEMKVSLINDEYVYDIVIDKTEIVMNKVQAMALTIGDVSNDKMEPTLGILEDEVYTMVPNQVDEDKNYLKGFVLGGTSKKPTFEVYVVVSWVKEDNSTPQNAYISFNVIDGVVQEDSGELYE